MVGTIEDDIDMNSNVSTMDPLHPKPIKSFFDVVHLRRARLAKQGTEIQTGWQEDWIRAYPALTDWKAEHIHTSVHAEVKLALNMFTSPKFIQLPYRYFQVTLLLL